MGNVCEGMAELHDQCSRVSKYEMAKNVFCASSLESCISYYTDNMLWGFTWGSTCGVVLVFPYALPAPSNPKGNNRPISRILGNGDCS